MSDEPQVMIVDDIAGTREIIKDMLTEIGFTRIDEASDGREALDKLKKQRAQLIICDYIMKDMSGLDLLNQLRTLPYLVDVPFIMVSAVGDVPVIEEAMNLGASDYIVKPVSFQLLRRKITDVLRRKVE